MYEWIPASILAFLVGLSFAGEAVESGRVETVRQRLHEPPDFPAMAF